MIYTDLENLKHYQGINKNLDTAIRYLIEKGTENLVPGRNEDRKSTRLNSSHPSSSRMPSSA